MSSARAARWSVTWRMRRRSKWPFIPWSIPTSALIFFNNAGIAGPQQPVEDIEVAAWQSTIDTDLSSVFYLTRRDPADEISAQRPHSQHVLQCRSLRLPNALPLRGSQVGRDWARPDLGDGVGLDIRVNALCPGSVGGERIDRVIDRDAAERGMTPDEIRRSTTPKLTQRLCEPRGHRRNGVFSRRARRPNDLRPNPRYRRSYREPYQLVGPVRMNR